MVWRPQQPGGLKALGRWLCTDQACKPPGAASGLSAHVGPFAWARQRVWLSWQPVRPDPERLVGTKSCCSGFDAAARTEHPADSCHAEQGRTRGPSTVCTSCARCCSLLLCSCCSRSTTAASPAVLQPGPSRACLSCSCTPRLIKGGGKPPGLGCFGPWLKSQTAPDWHMLPQAPSMQ